MPAPASLLSTPTRAVLLGSALAAAALLLAVAGGALDVHGAAALMLRALHVLAALVWGGLIAFVNIVQLAALAEAEAHERPVLMRLVVPKTARLFTGAAHATLATGVILLLPYATSLLARPMLLAGVLGGIVMWAIVQFRLRPAIARVTGKVAAGDAEKAAARAVIATWARVNLVLLVPVTLTMILAAHAGL